MAKLQEIGRWRRNSYAVKLSIFSIVFLILFMPSQGKQIKFTSFECRSVDSTFCTFESCILKPVSRNVKEISAVIRLHQTPVKNMWVSANDKEEDLLRFIHVKGSWRNKAPPPLQSSSDLQIRCGRMQIYGIQKSQSRGKCHLQSAAHGCLHEHQSLVSLRCKWLRRFQLYFIILYYDSMISFWITCPLMRASICLCPLVWVTMQSKPVGYPSTYWEPQSIWPLW